jgi:hypothetical protein
MVRSVSGTVAIAVVIAGGLMTGARATSVPVPSASALSAHPLAASQRWRAEDEAPASPRVHPVRVLAVSGEVSDPAALVHPAAGAVTTLTYPAGGRAPSLVLDYGRDVGGLPGFDAAAASSAGLEVSYSETLRNLGNDGAVTPALFMSGDGHRTDTFALARPGVVRAALIQGGERYEELTLSAPGTVTLRAAWIDFTPLRETPARMAGHFLSSDSLLNRIWYAGAYTLNLNQLTPGTLTTGTARNELHLILDGAKRDRAVWSGDHLISDLTDYYVSDPAYARDSLSLFLTHPASTAANLVLAAGTLGQPGPLPGACSPDPQAGNPCVTWSASYSLAVIPALAHYYLYTGDARFVRAHWAAVVRQMRWDAEQVDANGLFAVTTPDASDWNLETPTGEVTYVNALYVEALEAASELAGAVGDGADARLWSAAARRVAAAVNRRLWDARTRVYDASDGLRGPIVQDANVTAILAGIASPPREREILAALRGGLATPFGPAAAGPGATGYVRDISPYMGSFNVLADFAAGEAPAALRLIRREWGYMVSHDPGGVDWERIQPDGVPAGGSSSALGAADSSAHAWSTGPTAALSEFVLGVSPATEGYRRWMVAPTPTSLRWAQGVVPTPHGPLAVRWRRSGGAFVLTVLAPPHTTGAVDVPLLGARRRVIAMDGRVVWDGRRAAPGVHALAGASSVLFTGLRGRHTFAWVAG